MAQQRYAAVPPSEENVEKTRRNLVLTRRAVGLVLKRKCQFKSRGAEHFPKKGPVIFLTNHVSFLDPAIAIIEARRPIHFMVTQAAMNDPKLARVMQIYGAVPKKKRVLDPRAIKDLKKWAELGEPVGIFPEGERSWDGRRLPILPGIERLVKIIGAPVVTARFLNAHRQNPRWAEHPRRGPVILEFDPPKVFDKKTKRDEIRAYIEDRITIDPAKDTMPVRGRKLARGLTNLVFACPSCGTIEGLREEDEHVGCHECGGRWQVTSDNMMVEQRTGALLPIEDAVDRINTTAQRWWSVRAEAGGDVLESEPMALLDVTGDTVSTVGRGTLVLTSQTLELRPHGGGEPMWRVGLEDLSAASVDLRRRLQFIVGKQILEATMPRESVIKWKRAVEQIGERLRGAHR